MPRRWAIAALMLLPSAVVLADAGAVAYRQSLYKSIGGHMTAIAGILRREVDREADLALHAAAIADLAPLTLGLHGPDEEGTSSRARSSVQDDPQHYAQMQSEFLDATAALARVPAGDRPEFAAAWAEVGRTCQACHDRHVRGGP